MPKKKAAFFDHSDFSTEGELPDLKALFRKFPILPRYAISVRAPWSGFILCGAKDVENRSRPTKHRGPILIHAASKQPVLDEEDAELMAQLLGKPVDWENANFDIGGIIGVVDIVDCLPPGKPYSPWHDEESWGYVLKNPRKLPFTPCKGWLNVWPVKLT